MVRRIASLLSVPAIACLFGAARAEPPCPVEQAGVVRLGGQAFRVEVAATEIRRQAGLSGRPALPDDAGMLFVMTEPQVAAFWMPNMAFAIDLVWIDAERRVLGRETLAPCDERGCQPRLAPAPVLYVLEVNAGRFAGRPGDRIDWLCPAP